MFILQYMIMCDIIVKQVSQTIAAANLAGEESPSSVGQGAG